jgi:hypothetical protein
MNADLEYWRRRLSEAVAELDAARSRTAVNAAASKVQRVKAELKALEQKRPKRCATHASASAGASS